jgi:AraC-like DNA-binding protein
MGAIQFWQHLPAIQLAVMMPRSSKRGLKFNEHTHPFHELGCVLEGDCDWLIDGRREHLRTGDLILVPAGARHREETDDDGRARLVWIGFTQAGSPAIPAALSGALSSGDYEDEFQRLFAVVCGEHQGRAIGHAERAGLALREILILLCRLHPAGETTRPRVSAKKSRAPRLVQSAALTLTGNLAQPMRIRDLARYHSLSPSHFALLFRKHRGQTPRRFLQQARLEKATGLLQAADLNIKEIAAACGYVDAPHFCHAFKSATGLTPKQFRKANAA